MARFIPISRAILSLPKGPFSHHFAFEVPLLGAGVTPALGKFWLYLAFPQYIIPHGYC